MKFTDIKILTDENISPKVVTFLRKVDIDVRDVSSGMGGQMTNCYRLPIKKIDLSSPTMLILARLPCIKKMTVTEFCICVYTTSDQL